MRDRCTLLTRLNRILAAQLLVGCLLPSCTTTTTNGVLTCSKLVVEGSTGRVVVSGDSIVMLDEEENELVSLQRTSNGGQLVIRGLGAESIMLRTKVGATEFSATSGVGRASVQASTIGESAHLSLSDTGKTARVYAMCGGSMAQIVVQSTDRRARSVLGSMSRSLPGHPVAEVVSGPSNLFFIENGRTVASYPQPADREGRKRK